MELKNNCNFLNIARILKISNNERILSFNYRFHLSKFPMRKLSSVNGNKRTLGKVFEVT